jgi:hypothetical protein
MWTPWNRWANEMRQRVMQVVAVWVVVARRDGVGVSNSEEVPINIFL